MILGLDPSSTRTGYAVLTMAGAIVDGGYCRPRRTRDHPIDRALAMSEDVEAVIDEHKPRLCIVEIPSGKVHGRLMRRTGKNRRSPAGLSVYGLAVGLILGVAMRACRAAGTDIAGVEENVWTLGKSKLRRQREVAVQFPEYAAEAESDEGGDVSDAIGLALWAARDESAGLLKWIQYADNR